VSAQIVFEAGAVIAPDPHHRGQALTGDLAAAPATFQPKPRRIDVTRRGLTTNFDADCLCAHVPDGHPSDPSVEESHERAVW
jgi:hypothetical protein